MQSKQECVQLGMKEGSVSNSFIHGNWWFWHNQALFAMEHLLDQAPAFFQYTHTLSG